MAAHPNDIGGTVTLYVRLLEEGTNVSRPVQAEKIGRGLFKLIATPDYNSEDENWEFPPGSVVRADLFERDGNKCLIAVMP
jgi:hypothetical protein